MKLSIDPTDKSIWRIPMINTMPVLMTAMAEVCTRRFQRLRGVRNTPSPVRHWPMSWNPTKMRIKPQTTPSRGVSISVARKKRCTGLSVAIIWPAFASVTLAICASPNIFWSLPREGEDKCNNRAALASRAVNHADRSRFCNRLGGSALAAALDRARLDACAGFILADPTGVDHVAEVVLGDRIGRKQDGVHRHPLLPLVELYDAGKIGDLLAIGDGDRGLGGGLAEPAAVLPDRHGLCAKRDAVDRGEVAVLTRDWDLTVHALRLEGRDDAGGHAVILGHDSVDLVVLLGQALLHVLLRIIGLPPVGERLANVLDLAGVHGRLQNFRNAAEQEGCVRIALVALDEGVVSCRLGFQDFLGHQAGDADVVEGDVERVRILELHVIGDHFHASVVGRLDRG